MPSEGEKLAARRRRARRRSGGRAALPLQPDARRSRAVRSCADLRPDRQALRLGLRGVERARGRRHASTSRRSRPAGARRSAGSISRAATARHGIVRQQLGIGYVRARRRRRRPISAARWSRPICARREPARRRAHAAAGNTGSSIPTIRAATSSRSTARPNSCSARGSSGPTRSPIQAMIASAFRASGRPRHPGRVHRPRHLDRRASSFVAERFGAGRVWMAGDAVHLFTPSGGFGMNTGVDDAANLGWKLAAMVQGWGGAAAAAELRDRAAADRASATPARPKRWPAISATTPVAPEHRARTRRRARGAARGRRRILQRLSAGVRLARRAAWRALRRLADRGVRRPPPPADDLVDYRPSGVPGGRAPHVWIGDRPRHRRLAVRPLRRRASPCCGSGRGRRGPMACWPPSRARSVPVRALDVAESGGARSLRARYRGGAAGPACRLARQCRSAGRRSRIVAPHHWEQV